jgi:DNA invertase Pin-like site-specific DNA recombinase
MTPTPLKRAFGYVRVSSPGQADEDRDGIPRQKEAIRKWASANNVRIVRWFEDAITGKKDLDNRPALQDLMTALHSNGIKLVVIERLDRLARDLMVQESIIADIQRNNFEIISTVEPDLCSTDPTRVLLRQMMGAFAEYERKMIVQKLRGARARAAAKNPNYREGRKPFGFRPGEQDTLARIHELRDNGHTLTAIVQTLHSEGHKPRGKRARWHEKTIQRILARR